MVARRALSSQRGLVYAPTALTKFTLNGADPLGAGMPQASLVERVCIGSVRFEIDGNVVDPGSLKPRQLDRAQFSEVSQY